MQWLDSSWCGGIGGPSRASLAWGQDLYYLGGGEEELPGRRMKSTGEWREGGREGGRTDGSCLYCLGGQKRSDEK